MNNTMVYILGYPFVRKSQIFNCVYLKNKDMWCNYYLFDGELLETWEVGQLLGGN
jgi:uncharacterized protein YhbP (UPF0306 family)